MKVAQREDGWWVASSKVKGEIQPGQEEVARRRKSKHEKIAQYEWMESRSR
jgi:hypothetical protein